MDTSLEDIYQQHPRLKPDASDSHELANLKQHYVWLHSMTPEEREEHDRMEMQAERKREIESLIDEYKLNQSIKASAEVWAKNMGWKARQAIEAEDRPEAEKYIGYIRTAKQTMQLVDQDQIRIRQEIKDVRRNGTWYERLQAKIKARQQKKS